MQVVKTVNPDAGETRSDDFSRITPYRGGDVVDEPICRFQRDG